MTELNGRIYDPKTFDDRVLIIDPATNTNQPREGLVTVLLEHKTNGKLAYQFTFETTKDKSVVKRFLDVLQLSKGKSTAVASVVPLDK